MRLIDLLMTAAEYLKKKGFEHSRLEVERMLGSVLDLSRLNLYMDYEREITEQELERFRELVKRRVAHEPLQYIIGKTSFREVEIKTDHRALIPRPETEILVQAAVEFLRNRENPLIADLGTGTGSIALSVVYELPGTRAIAVDISDDALILARHNARRLGVEHMITFVSGDMLKGLEGRGPFDAILSNPPYVRSGDIEELESEVRDYEPAIALDGGSEGLDYVNAIASDAHEFLKSDGLLLIECDSNQVSYVTSILEKTHSYAAIDRVKDLTGKERIVRAHRR